MKRQGSATKMKTIAKRSNKIHAVDCLNKTVCGANVCGCNKPTRKRERRKRVEIEKQDVKAIEKLPCKSLMPEAGQIYRDNDGNMHTIIEVTTMFENQCIKYEALNKAKFVMFSHYVDVKVLHLHSSKQFWFKEPLTDSI